MDTDKINIPVDIALDPQVAQVINQLKARLKAELATISEEMLKGKFPTSIPTVTGAQRFQAGGREYEISGRTKLNIPPEGVLGEQGELNVASLTSFAATIKEVRDRLNQGLTVDEGRLKEFKNAIKFQPIRIKQEAIKKFIDEFGDINNELANRLESITNIIDRKDFQKISNQALSKPIEEREKFYQEILNKDNRFTDELNRRIANIRRFISKRGFTEASADINLKPLEEQEKAYEEILSRDKTFEKEINRRLIRIRGHLGSKGFREASADINLKPLEEQEKLLQDLLLTNPEFERSINRRIVKIKRHLGSKGFKEASADINLKPLEEQEKLLQDLLLTNPEFERLINRRITKIKRHLGSKGFRESIADINLKPLEKQEKLLQDLLLTNPEFERLINRRIQALKNKRPLKDFLSTKSRISQLPLEDQFKEWEAYIKAPEALVERANIEIRKLSGQFVKSTQNMNRRRFTDWSKKLQLLDPSDALAELDRYITAPFSKFVNDARIMRQRISRNMERQNQQMMKERQKEFANMALIGAGAGLGLLGPAGFPLLNIGFAAMSGGVPGAAIAAFATGLGEASRAIEGFRQNMIKAAQDTKFIPMSFRKAEAASQGYDAVLGAVALGVEAVAKKRELENWRRRGSDPADLISNWTVGRKAFKEQFDEFLFSKTMDFWGKGDSIFERFSDIKRESRKNLPDDLDSAYRNALREMYKGMPGIETDAYEVWKRIQSAAYDPSKQVEMEIQKQIIEELRKNTEAIKEANERQKFSSKSGSSFPFLLTGPILP